MGKEHFNFDEWCAGYELNEDTIRALGERGHRSHLSISVMVTDDIKKDFKKLMPAKILLLERAVKDYHAAQTGLPDTRPQQDTHSAAPPTLDAGATHPLAPPAQCLSVEDVLHRCGLSDTSRTDTGNTVLTTDPYRFGAGPYRSNKLRELGKFITFHPAGKPLNEDSQYITVGGVQLRTTEQKVPLSKVTQISIWRALCLY